MPLEVNVTVQRELPQEMLAVTVTPLQADPPEPPQGFGQSPIEAIPSTPAEKHVTLTRMASNNLHIEAPPLLAANDLRELTELYAVDCALQWPDGCLLPRCSEGGNCRAPHSCVR